MMDNKQRMRKLIKGLGDVEFALVFSKVIEIIEVIDKAHQDGTLAKQMGEQPMVTPKLWGETFAKAQMILDSCNGHESPRMIAKHVERDGCYISDDDDVYI